MYWLDCAATPQAKLKDLDRVLRRTWLECCGHLSEFYEAGRRKVSMSTRIGQALGLKGNRLEYEYDFGSTTALVVSLSGVVETGPGEPVRVVARNEPPTWPCDVCGQPATMICVQCVYEGRGFCCGVHAKKHPCGRCCCRLSIPRVWACAATRVSARTRPEGSEGASATASAKEQIMTQLVPAVRELLAKRQAG